MLKVIIDLDAIRHNYLFLRQKSAAELMPVVKADAYGHGLLKVSEALFALGARFFAVGTVDEGVRLKKHLPEAEICSLLGPLSADDFKTLSAFSIIPFVHCWAQLKGLAAILSGARQLEIGIKFDAGMNRLGFKPEVSRQLIEFFRSNQALIPRIMSSHLACADIPAMNDVVRAQLNSFNSACEVFHQAGFKFRRSLANSAALLHHPHTHGDLVRPGIALYGGNPVARTLPQDKNWGLRQAMKVSAPVLSVHNLARGQGISYGLGFVAPRDMSVAIIGCGYADNYSRSLSNRSWMLFEGHRLPILGRVCMQLSAVDVSFVSRIDHGDRVFLLGGEGAGDIDVHELAGWWKTVSYEVFCLLGKNERIFINC